MKDMIRRILLLAAALVLAAGFSLPAFAEEEEIPLEDLDLADIETVNLETPLVANPLPIDFTAGYEPQESGYLDEYTYQDPTIQVKIEFKDVSEYGAMKGRTTGAWIADIRIGDASQLRTAAAESFEVNNAWQFEAIARPLHPVVACNGDYVTRLNEGFILRQGILFKDKLKKKDGRDARDVLMIDENGDFHVFVRPGKGELSETVDGKKVINAFYFGPVLVENGEVPDKMTSFTYLEPDDWYTRLAICQVGPLHYKIILTTNKQDSNLTSGLKMKDFARLCKDEGALTAFNLDGGYSTTLFFRGERVNAQKHVNFREVPDIVYFASAWNGGDAE